MSAPAAYDAHGVRVRVGAWHLPLADLLNAFTRAGLRLDRAAESTANGIADVFVVRAVKAGRDRRDSGQLKALEETA